jgi:hypothetical protein
MKKMKQPNEVPRRYRTVICFLSLFLGLNVLNKPRHYVHNCPSETLGNIVQDRLRSNSGVSLVTSFWAAQEGDTSQPDHRREIEAAILVNLQNPHFQQVVVILDSVSNETMDCKGFVEFMTRQLDGLAGMNATISYGHIPGPELLCIERTALSGQPSYREMFHYATFHPSISSEIVVLSNADQVFDDTMFLAAQIPKNTIFILSTHGYNASRVPPTIRQLYQKVVGDDSNGTGSSLCVHHEWGIPITTMRHSYSWDTFIYQRSLLHSSLSGNEQETQVMTRSNFWRKRKEFYMNEMGAETAALYDVTLGLHDNVSVWNACEVIRSWHFHMSPKTHHGGGKGPEWPKCVDFFKGGYIFYQDNGIMVPLHAEELVSNLTRENVPNWVVPPPYASAPICTGFASCYGEGLKSATLVQSARWEDAPKVV